MRHRSGVVAAIGGAVRVHGNFGVEAVVRREGVEVVHLGIETQSGEAQMAHRLVGQGIAKRHVTDAEEVGLLEEARRVVHHVVRVRRTVGHGPRPVVRWVFRRPTRLKFVAEDGVSVRRTALSAASGIGPFPRGVDLGAEGVLEVQPEVEAFIGKVVDEGARGALKTKCPKGNGGKG